MTSQVYSYSKEEVECLQRHVQRNLSAWIGLREFLKEYRQTMEEVLYFWGPMAEEIHSGKDVTKEHFPA